MSNYSLMFKFIIIGDAGNCINIAVAVGKSCIVLQLIENQIRLDHDTTIGVEFGAKVIKVDGMNIKLQIWDTAGQENFRSIIRSYYRSAIGALLVYDITKRDTFHNLQRWMDEIRNNGNPSLVIMLCGNKVDKEAEYLIFKFAQQHGLLFMETSAKDGTNVQNAFFQSSQQILKDINEGKVILGQDPGIKIGGQFKKELKTTSTYEDAVQLKQLNKQETKQCC